MGIKASGIVSALRNGDIVKCDSCGEGSFVPLNGKDYKTALLFKCSNCGKLKWLYKKTDVERVSHHNGE